MVPGRIRRSIFESKSCWHRRGRLGGNAFVPGVFLGRQAVVGRAGGNRGGVPRLRDRPERDRECLGDVVGVGFRRGVLELQSEVIHQGNGRRGTSSKS